MSNRMQRIGQLFVVTQQEHRRQLLMVVHRQKIWYTQMQQGISVPKLNVWSQYCDIYDEHCPGTRQKIASLHVAQMKAQKVWKVL